MKTLRGKFFVFILIPTILILSAKSLLSYLSAKNLLTDQMERSAINHLEASAERLHASIGQIEAGLDVLALAEQFGEARDSRRLRMFIELKNRWGEGVTSVFMGFPDGRFIRAKTDPLPPGYDPRTRPWYRAALALEPGTVNDITDPYLDASTGRPVITVLRKIISNDSGLIGVLGVDLDVDRVSRSLDRKIPVPSGGRTFLLSSQAHVLLDSQETMIGRDIGSSGEPLDRELSGRIQNSDQPFGLFTGERNGQLWLAGFHRIARTSTFYALMVPAREVFTPLFSLSVRMAALAVILVGSLLILLIFVTRKISRPILALKESAVRVADGGSYQNPLTVKSQDEVGELTGAFNAMMDGLRQRDFIRDTFGRYVTREVVDELLGSPDGLKLGGETREITIMFSDLRGFTPLTEHLHPNQVIEILNRYLGKMTSIITRFKGTINEFIGDGILTFFGAPVQLHDNPQRAVACAVAMQLAMAEVNRENGERGLPPVSMGIGINTGDVIVGNIGSRKRAKYGVVGHHINLTSRVEGATVGGQILMTQSTFNLVKGWVAVGQTRTLNFKGVEEGVTLYDVTGVGSPYDLELPREERDEKALLEPLAVWVQRMRGKQAGGASQQGLLTHFSSRWVRVTLPGAIDAARELRLNLNTRETGEPVYLYGKVVETTPAGQGTAHLIRISYAPPEAAELINAGQAH